MNNRTGTILLIYLVIGPPTGLAAILLAIAIYLQGVPYIALARLPTDVPIAYIVGGLPALAAGIWVSGRIDEVNFGFRSVLKIGLSVGVASGLLFLALMATNPVNWGRELLSTDTLKEIFKSLAAISYPCLVATVVCWMFCSRTLSKPSSRGAG